MGNDAGSAPAAWGVDCGMPVVVAEDLAVTYGRGGRCVSGLASATFWLERGDRVAVVGPSGSGKSTLLHVIAGLLAASAGSIAWPALTAGGRMQPGSVGVVFQGSSLVPSLDVVENVELPLLMHTVLADDVVRRRARSALEELGLVDLAHALPTELSRGQAQRVAVARALAARPSLLCADEPTGQLDLGNAGIVTDQLLHAAGLLGAPLIVATHDQRVAARMETTWTIEDGRLAATR